MEIYIYRYIGEIIKEEVGERKRIGGRKESEASDGRTERKEKKKTSTTAEIYYLHALYTLLL